MRYILNARYRLRGWEKVPCGLHDTARHETIFMPTEVYQLLLKLDGAHDLDEETLSEKDKSILQAMEKEGVIRPAGAGEFILPEQEYHDMNCSVYFPGMTLTGARSTMTGAPVITFSRICIIKNK